MNMHPEDPRHPRREEGREAMTYTLTAEQMQQVREALALAKFSNGIGRMGGLDWAKPNHPSGILYAADWDGRAVSITQGDILKAQAAIAILDAAKQSAVETTGGDVREAYKARRRMMSEYLTEAELRELENICHPVDDALDAQHAALAAAPKPCEHGCVDGVITAYTLNRGTQKIDCPIHGTKPEAPTELCKVCGQIQAHWHHADNVPAANCHPFTTTDATPKDEETGR